MDYYFDIYCSVCESETRVIVLGNEEAPDFCPMCGSEAETVKETEDDLVLPKQNI